MSNKRYAIVIKSLSHGISTYPKPFPLLIFHDFQTSHLISLFQRLIKGKRTFQITNSGNPCHIFTLNNTYFSLVSMKLKLFNYRWSERQTHNKQKETMEIFNMEKRFMLQHSSRIGFLKWKSHEAFCLKIEISRA